MRFTESSSDTILLYHNTGIGTTTPDTRLDVTASGVNGVVINQDGSNADISSRLFLKNKILLLHYITLEILLVLELEQQ